MNQLHSVNQSHLGLFEDGVVRIMVINRGQKVVNERDLHKGLHVRKDSSSWMKDRIEKYEFVGKKDFSLVWVKSSKILY
ncbi:antA/AntB antirepressor family protein [Bacillus thuringiensis]|uniref:antA/AntB antirepressor family protein n=1 Tax=Bacillus thuringiensis TaxID=1428 RepID=UPI0018CE1A06|nr:antA/AntB antirepressor family protein [Bacillus thuringiensis]